MHDRLNIKNKMNIKKSIIPRVIIPILIFAVILNILRIIIWGKFSYLYLLWNILLAFVPYLISLMLTYFHKEDKLNNFFLILGSFFWLLFIPNAPYLITDFIHLDEVKHAPLLYDAFLLFSSALVGLLFGLFSISHIENLMKNKFSEKTTRIIMLILFVIIGFGIYLGRFLRFNSWDFFTNHISIWSGISLLFSELGSVINVILYTLLFSSFVFVSYKSWKYMNPSNI